MGIDKDKLNHELDRKKTSELRALADGTQLHKDQELQKQLERDAQEIRKRIGTETYAARRVDNENLRVIEERQKILAERIEKETAAQPLAEHKFEARKNIAEVQVRSAQSEADLKDAREAARKAANEKFIAEQKARADDKKAIAAETKDIAETYKKEALLLASVSKKDIMLNTPKAREVALKVAHLEEHIQNVKTKMQTHGLSLAEATDIVAQQEAGAQQTVAVAKGPNPGQGRT